MEIDPNHFLTKYGAIHSVILQFKQERIQKELKEKAEWEMMKLTSKGYGDRIHVLMETGDWITEEESKERIKSVKQIKK